MNQPDPLSILRSMNAMPSSRREFLQRSGVGFGSIAMAGLLAEEPSRVFADSASAGQNSLNPMSPKQPHFAPKAKAVIHLFMNGGPSQVDTFDPKPALDKYHGQALPNNLRTERETGAAYRSPFKFKRYGGQRIVLARRRNDRRRVCRSFDARQRTESRTVADVDELWRCDIGSASGRLVGYLWVGKRQSKLTRIHCDVPKRLSDQRVRELAIRLFARRLSRDLR